METKRIIYSVVWPVCGEVEIPKGLTLDEEERLVIEDAKEGFDSCLPDPIIHKMQESS